jgi:hypothetical protein
MFVRVFLRWRKEHAGKEALLAEATGEYEYGVPTAKKYHVLHSCVRNTSHYIALEHRPLKSMDLPVIR